MLRRLNLALLAVTRCVEDEATVLGQDQEAALCASDFQCTLDDGSQQSRQVLLRDQTTVDGEQLLELAFLAAHFYALECP